MGSHRRAGVDAPGAQRDPLAIAGVAAALISLVLSASRGALLGLAVGLVFLLVLIPVSTRLVVGGIGLGVGLLALLTPFTQDRLTGESPLAAGTAAGRTLALGRHRHLASRTPDLRWGAIGIC